MTTNSTQNLLSTTTESALSETKGLSISLKPRSSSFTGRTEMKIRPKISSLACNNVQKMSTIRVSCPPNRRLVFRDPTTLTSTTASTTTTSTSHGSTSSSSEGTTSSTTATFSGSINPNLNPNCSTAPATYTLPSGSWVSDFQTWLRPSYEKVQTYDCQAYGIPASTYYGDYFSPVFELYDGDVFVKTVKADIALWEFNGRNTFDYNMTNHLVSFV
jgi:hypothetical protein